MSRRDTIKAADMAQHATHGADDVPPPVRATIAEAAKLLGASENAVRKRIERGTLRSEKADGSRYVLLDGDTSRRAANERFGMSDEASSSIYGMPEFVASLQDQIEHLRDQLDQEREANRENRRLLAAALERILNFEPPRGAPREVPREAPVTPSGGEG